MKHHLNTLFITTDGSYLAKEGEAVLVRVEKQTKLRVPLHTLGGIVCFGRVGISPALMGLCGERGVAISLLTSTGKFLARINGFTSGNVLLRREQYRRADDPAASAAIARSLIAAKIANARSVLLRNLRDYPDAAGASSIQAAVVSMAGTLQMIQPGLPLDSLRGLEGEAANAYFSVFDHLIVNQKEDAEGKPSAFSFRSRSRRPPLDPVNALLSFLYAMLAHDARCACEAAGLDPAVGFLHRDRPGRPGLALDLMEEFRPFLADRLARSLINRRQVSPGGFTVTESGAVRMDDATRKAVLVAYQKRKQEEILHPFLGEKTTIGLLVHLQARLLARYLRGDLDAYPAFIWR
jgi:CRISPR-associated protein Cas1